jgi:predicted transcriptional regulator of viral defense system
MKNEKIKQSVNEKAQRIIKEYGGIIRTAQAIKSGIHPRIFYTLRDSGVLEQVSRGVYRLSRKKPLSNPDLITVAVRFPRAIICLVSALAFHEITTQVPHAVFIALEKGAETPQISHPPLSVHRFSKESLLAGVEEYDIDSVKVRIYSPEKTLADCFKFRNKIGMDVVIEAMRLYRTRKKINLGELIKFARICRVERVMKPYLEALI